MKKNYEFLDQINFPSDLKKVPETKLQKVADELREDNDYVSVDFRCMTVSLGNKEVFPDGNQRIKIKLTETRSEESNSDDELTMC